MLGTLRDLQGRVIDQALAVYTRAPHTYTGEDTVELQCHGSPAVPGRPGWRRCLPLERGKRAPANLQSGPF